MLENNESAYSEIEKRKKIIKIVAIVAATLILIPLIIIFARKKAVEVATDKIMEQVFTQQAMEKITSEESDEDKSNVDESKKSKSVDEQVAKEVREALNRIEPSDRKKIEKVVSKHMNMDLVNDAVKYLKAGDIEGLRKRAENEISPEEIDMLMKIYEKYKDDF